MGWLGAILSLPAAVVLWIIVRSPLARRTTVSDKPQRVVIIGASSGIGCQLAKDYAQRGARLILVARRSEMLKQVVDECQQLNAACECSYVVADITSEADVSRCAQRSTEILGGIDVLVLCSGVLSIRPFDQLCGPMSSKELERVQNGGASESYQLIDMIFKTNVYGPILCTKYFLPELVKSKGQIVVVGSLAGTVAAPTRSLYASTKFALMGFFNALRIEYGHRGVAVTIVLPGSVRTDLRRSALDSPTAERQMNFVSPTAIPVTRCSEEILLAADRRERERYIPAKYWFAALVHFFFPAIVDGFAAKKYGFVN
ncbi:uncharacterized protein BJ171DRAFT_588901 [Polychytrium aggregatum]|uniref:uncharacterized protein n=1 Tax=Polychytrium aggregatum TaxID=110093 RepID=UPI0022FE3311|nr:uncharacterized protein BJ171DRAFT_588901 [Polychytrium aggregatum]KAI9193168.1 hypothetical protein BJ171DRAFT_588901 [Polychytrium aggregatum]